MVGDERELGAVLQPKDLKQRCYVGFDGALADAQLVGEGLVVLSYGCANFAAIFPFVHGADATQLLSMSDMEEPLFRVISQAAERRVAEKLRAGSEVQPIQLAAELLDEFHRQVKLDGPREKL